jgi:hypothetical protein
MATIIDSECRVHLSTYQDKSGEKRREAVTTIINSEHPWRQETTSEGNGKEEEKKKGQGQYINITSHDILMPQSELDSCLSNVEYVKSRKMIIILALLYKGPCWTKIQTYRNSFSKQQIKQNIFVYCLISKSLACMWLHWETDDCKLYTD